MPNPNRALFESVVRLLAPVLDELVFVGGCTTGIFITDPVASGIRPTRGRASSCPMPPARLVGTSRAMSSLPTNRSGPTSSPVIRLLLDNQDFVEALHSERRLRGLSGLETP